MSRRPTSLSPRAAVLVVAAAVLAGLTPVQAALLPGGPASDDGACTTAVDPAAAAVELYGAGTELVRTEEVAGLSTALVLEPRIAPGTRRRMLELGSDGGWCDAATGFNRAAGLTGAAAATAFASVAAAPYFDGVTVTGTRELAGGLVEVSTHARTNGVDARWVVATDGSGVRTATWTATAFAQQPMAGESEGLTALPGATETYTRAASGLLEERRGLPTVESAHAARASAAGVATYTSPDDFTIRVSLGDARVALDPGVKTGVREVDAVQETVEALALNYQEFYDWGLRKGWRSDLDLLLPDTGWMYLNDSLSLYCFACVFIAEDFQIHMLSEVGLVLAALGFTGYADPRAAYDNVVGHEMFHNFQNAYNKPGLLGRSAGRGVSTAYSEGTARFQETLHSYSGVSFAPKTLYTGGQTNPPLLSLDANHCNGYAGSDVEAAVAAGPFPKTYNACWFWTSWYTQNGLDAFVRLIAEGIPAHSPKGNVEEGLLAIGTAAPGVPVAEQIAYSALSGLTGRYKTVSAPSGDPTPRDWGSFLFRVDPPALSGADGRTVGGGGFFARRVVEDTAVTLSGAGAVLFEVRAGSAGDVLRRTDGRVLAPAAGEKVWVVAVNPTTTQVAVGLDSAPLG
ncbi:MAG TPA: hypothetical protein VNU26_17985 [Mycobacteriales bacterium]|nr:hypothetical protein [Mycobacteriales bacterium]